MSDVNLMTHFRGTEGNYTCPIPGCPTSKDFDSAHSLRSHLWTHRDEDSNGPEVPRNKRSGTCPWPGCAKARGGTRRHFLTHTKDKPYACPHLVTWEAGHRQLCNVTRADKHNLDRHRLTDHGYDRNNPNGPVLHPWVEKADIPLAYAVLHYGGRKRAQPDKDKVKQEEDTEGIELDRSPSVEPLEQDPTQPPDNNTETTTQDRTPEPTVPQSPQNATGSSSAPGRTPEPTPAPQSPRDTAGSSSARVPPDPQPHNQGAPNNSAPRTQPEARLPENPYPDTFPDGSTIMESRQVIRQWRLVPSTQRRWAPYPGVWVNVPRYELFTTLVHRRWRQGARNPTPHGA